VPERVGDGRGAVELGVVALELEEEDVPSERGPGEGAGAADGAVGVAEVPGEARLERQVARVLVEVGAQRLDVDLRPRRGRDEREPCERRRRERREKRAAGPPRPEAHAGPQRRSAAASPACSFFTSSAFHWSAGARTKVVRSSRLSKRPTGRWKTRA